jgi:hypothetical protein
VDLEAFCRPMVAAERRDSALKRRSRSESSWLPAAVRDPACNTYPSPLRRSPNAAPVLPRRRYLLNRVAASAAPFLEQAPADPNHSSRGEGLTVPLIERAERDAELGAKWSRDWRAGGTRYSDLPGALGNAPDDRVTRAAGHAEIRSEGGQSIVETRDEKWRDHEIQLRRRCHHCS